MCPHTLFVFVMCCLNVIVQMSCIVFFFFKQNTAYEMRISAWSSDVCSSDLVEIERRGGPPISQSRLSILLREKGGSAGGVPATVRQIGRASCRERVCQYV